MKIFFKLWKKELAHIIVIIDMMVLNQKYQLFILSLWLKWSWKMTEIWITADFKRKRSFDIDLKILKNFVLFNFLWQSWWPWDREMKNFSSPTSIFLVRPKLIGDFLSKPFSKWKPNFLVRESFSRNKSTLYSIDLLFLYSQDTI